MSTTSLSNQFVQLASEASRAPPTTAIRRASARTLFDFFACVIGGSETGAQLSWPLDRAGQLAVSAHRRDQDDLRLRSFTHPGGVIWSAVTEAALERVATLSEAVRAASLGYEVTVRLADALGASHRRRWHTTTTAGTVGAAAASALLLGGDSACMIDAVGHGLSVAGGSTQALIERSGTRLLHRAHAASSGVACARAACSELSASRFGLEHERGVVAFPSFSAFAADLLRPRTTSAIEETGFRLYPANGFAHAAIDAALEIGAINPETITRVRVAVSPPAGVRLASNTEPGDDEEAWWSIEHAVAVCLCAGEATALSAGMSERPDVRELCRRIELAADGMAGGQRSRSG